MRRLWFGLLVWICMVTAAPALASEASPPIRAQLLQTLVELGALPQSPDVTAHLQLLQSLLEIDLGMTEAAEARLATIQGSITVTETVAQLRILLALRRQQLHGTPLATEALTTVVPPRMDEARRLTLALQQQAGGDTSGAIATLSRLRHDTPFLSTATLDLALLLQQAGERDYAIDLLQLLGNSTAQDEETERLRDHANLVLARTLQQVGMSDQALTALERIRLDGPDGSAALLLLGWVKLESSGPEAALVPWLELLARDGNDPAVLEARLAVPLALSRHAPDQQALTQLQAVSEEYQQRLLLLDGSIAELSATPELARTLQLGVTLSHGSSQRAAALAQAEGELRALAQRWPSVDAQREYDAEPLREALLLQLRSLDRELAPASHLAMWREFYSRLQRYLAEAFAAKRVTIGKRPFDPAPFLAERRLLDEAAQQMGHLYHNELLATLQLQRRRVAGYQDQARYAVARLHELALLEQLEGR